MLKVYRRRLSAFALRGAGAHSWL